MKARELKPVIPELKQVLVEMAAGQAARAGAGKRRRRALGRPFLATATAAGAVTAALLIVLGGGAAVTSVRAERADAADLARVAAMTPHLQLAGPWQIVSTKSSPSRGWIKYRADGHSPALISTEAAEIRWDSASLEQRGARLEAEGFNFAGGMRMDVTRPAAIGNPKLDFEDVKRALVYADPVPGRPDFKAVGLWREGGRTLEYRAVVSRLGTLELLMERIEIMDAEEWLVALQPGGGRWLSESGGGRIEKLEKVKVGESADGKPIYGEGGLLTSPEPGEKLDFQAPLPIVYHEGDSVRVVIRQPPKGLEAP